MKSTLVLSIIVLFIASCKMGTTESVSNTGINSELRNRINQLDQSVLNSIVNNDIETFKNQLSTKLLSIKNLDIDGLFNQITSIYKNNEYEIIDQYHIQNSTSNLGNTLFSGVEQDGNYRINLQSMNEETFVSLILPKNELDKYYILNVYGKYPEGWKLNIIQFGHYSINNQNAPQLYRKAQTEYSKGYLMDAANTMFLNSKIIKPSKAFTYMEEELMNNYMEQIITELKDSISFPIEITKINSKPRIMNVYPQRIDEGYFPVIEYVTKIDITDTTKLKIEYEKLKNEIPNIFNGIDKGKEYVFYKAFSQIPDGKTEVPTYGFVHELK